MPLFYLVMYTTLHEPVLLTIGVFTVPDGQGMLIVVVRVMVVLLRASRSARVTDHDGRT